MNVEYKNIIGKDHAWHYRIVPEDMIGDTLVCLIDEKKYTDEIRLELEIVLDKKVRLVEKESEVIQALLSKNYSQKQDYGVKNLKHAKPEEILEILIKESFFLESSDIHIEPTEDKAFVRYRKDGKLVEKYLLDKEVHLIVINKLKILSKLDISEKRLPQDGRLKLSIDKDSIDLRVSTLPTLHGEKAVLRLLKQNASQLSVDKLGMDEYSLKLFQRGLKRAQGLILISGPTGSGKTTTLYSGLKSINRPDTNILTIEDPIEYTLQGLNQVQLRENIGLTYTKALKSFLRQDPDIIMVGEIRDADTANMVMRAALTGHLVLSTIHTNSAWETIERLEDLGIQRFSIGSTLALSMAQRLIRKLCEACKATKLMEEYSEEENRLFNGGQSHTYKPIGCEECDYTGFSGRIAIYEAIEINELAAKMIREKRDAGYVYEELKVPSLSHQAVDCFRKGLTSFEEIYSYTISGR